jgi:hypothetical protein
MEINMLVLTPGFWDRREEKYDKKVVGTGFRCILE